MAMADGMYNMYDPQSCYHVTIDHIFYMQNLDLLTAAQHFLDSIANIEMGTDKHH